MAWKIKGSGASAPAGQTQASTVNLKRDVAPAVTLHLGAHKTASTHLQKTWATNLDLLARHGCTYLGPDRLRHDLKIPRLRGTVEGFRAKLGPLLGAVRDAQAAGQRLLLSNENIFGGGPIPPILALGAAYYPRAEAHLEPLLAGLGLEDVTIALALRNPIEQLVSGWGHQHLAGRVTRFEDYCAEVDRAALRWSDLIVRILSSTRVAHVVLWRFEDYCALMPALAARLAGLPEGTVLRAPDEHSPRSFLVGPSARALEAVPGILARNPGLAPRDALRRAMTRFPKSAAWPGPVPVPDAEIAASRARYAQEWGQLRGMDRVTCLAP